MRIYKLSGAGNDFLALIEPESPPPAERIRAWCRRGLSLGADGLILLERSANGARMVYFNSDGGRGDLCLNGARCAARLALELGWDDGGTLRLETDCGLLTARRAVMGDVAGDVVAVDLPDLLETPEKVHLEVESTVYSGWLTRVGVPHLVLPWAATGSSSRGLADAPVATLGRRLRFHPELGEEGANVDFVHFVAPHRLEIRAYERGVEAETLACGTGIVAAVAVGVYDDRLALPVTVLTAGGFELTVDGELRIDADGEIDPNSHLVLTGDARLVARVDLLDGASTLPKPPSWS